MIKEIEFKEWLSQNTNYSEATQRDTLSRMNRADKILEWKPIDSYIYYLEGTEEFASMSVSVKSQIRRAVRSYIAFYKSTYPDEMKSAFKRGE